MRTARQPSRSDIYHVVGKGVGSQIVFEEDGDRVAFLDLLKRHLVEAGADLYVWCLMDNHYHLLVHAKLDQLSRCMKLLGSSYALGFNAKHGRTGHLFQDRFKSEPVDDDARLLSTVRYIHRNPEQAGMCSYASYRWSSYGEYAGEPRLCETGFVLDAFGSLDEFALFHRSRESERCLDIDMVRSASRSMPDAQAIVAASEALGKIGTGIGLDQVKVLGKAERNAALRALKRAGLSIKQIERMTGVNRGAVQRA